MLRALEHLKDSNARGLECADELSIEGSQTLGELVCSEGFKHCQELQRGLKDLNDAKDSNVDDNVNVDNDV